MLTYLLITVAGLAVVLAAEWRGLNGVQWIAKPLASWGFVAAAFSLDPFATPYGCWLFAGLLLSFAGDVLLIPKKTTVSFLLGLAAFLLAHVAYTVAFLIHGVLDPTTFLIAIPLLTLGVGVVRRLWPRLPGKFRVAVPLYVLAITTMLVCAFAATCPPADPWPSGWAPCCSTCPTLPWPATASSPPVSPTAPGASRPTTPARCCWRRPS
jgi:uncharacterized membrane protein YhhN